MEPKHIKLAVLASGRGTNFLALREAIQRGDLDAEICGLFSDQAGAPALDRARELGVPAISIQPQTYANKAAYETELVARLRALDIDLVVLAGYMRLVGPVMLEAYKLRIVNIHPALLPAFAGLHAQRQALDYGVKVSGCTVHFVDEGMDTGPIILQAVVPVFPEDSEASLSNRILMQEHHAYAQALQLLAEGRIYIEGRTIYIN
ncbi:MAG: phosphoribosylglycinamide formyltransferase [Firmicutes bacterium]|nr:phosphoribosylglycinamide formyltransferase [Bacillota bacterium]